MVEQTVILDKRTDKSQSLEHGNFVTCTNCGKIMLVDIGCKHCPECKEDSLTCVAVSPEMPKDDYDEFADNTIQNIHLDSELIYYNVTPVVNQMIDGKEIICYEGQHKRIYICCDVNNFWLLRISKNHDKGTYLVEGNKFSFQDVLNMHNTMNDVDMSLDDKDIDRIRFFIGKFPPLDIIKAVIKLDDLSGLETIESKEASSLDEAIALISDDDNIIPLDAEANIAATIDFEVTCFDRYITFTLSPYVAKVAMETLNKAYDDWMIDDKCWCCEEYLCHCLTEAGIKYSYEYSEVEEDEEE